MAELDPQRWQRLRPLLDRALDLSEGERADFLAGLNESDAELRGDLVELLQEHARSDDSPSLQIAEVAAPLLARDLVDESGAEDARLGQAVGVFRLVRLIGSGGMGAVYLAERSSGDFQQEVAIKVIRHAVASSVARERFERERQILAGLVHPNIARLLDGGQTADGQPYYTMEFVPGVAITDYCRDRKLGVEDRVRLLLKVAAALAYAHQRLVVHRDIKPSNILVKADRQVMLLDFGIAKLIGEAAQQSVTLAAVGPMTPEYAAPEQFRNAEITLATDIYQLGALCYRVLTARFPYLADPTDAYAWARAVAEDDPVTLRHTLTQEVAGNDGQPVRGLARLRRRVAGDLDAILRKAMAKAPADRYQSMDALAADLKRFLDGRPVSARQMGAMFHAWRFVVRRPIASAAALVAIAGLVATTLVAVRQADLKAREAERANSEARRATAVADFLIGLFQVSDPGVNRGEKLSANEILARGAAKIDHDFTDQPAQKGRLQTVIGEVYSSLGENAKASEILTQAVATLKSDPGVDPVDLGHDLRMLAWNRHRLADEQGALVLLNEAAAVLELSNSPLALAEKGGTHSHLALVRKAMGEGRVARAEFAVAIEFMEKAGAGNTIRIATVYNNLGLLLRDLDEDAEAERQLRKALEIYRRELGEDHPRTVETLENLGWVLIESHRLDEARVMIEAANAQKKRLLGEHSADYATSINELGDLYRRLGENAKAMVAFVQAEAVYREVYAEKNAILGWPIENIGKVHLDEGDWNGALTSFDRALAIRRALLPADHPEIAVSYEMRARALLLLGRYEEARKDAELGVAIRRAKLPESPTVVRTLVQLGLARYALHDVAGAKIAWDEALVRGARAYARDPDELASLRRTIADPDATLHPAMKKSR
ncbi:MAG TPA: serine/threonine-protein kinase [Rudaea sp.]